MTEVHKVCHFKIDTGAQTEPCTMLTEFTESKWSKIPLHNRRVSRVHSPVSPPTVRFGYVTKKLCPIDICAVDAAAVWVASSKIT